MLKMSEVNKLEKDAIELRVSELRKELFNLRLQKNTTNVEKSHTLKVMKRDIARLLTAKNSKVSN
ncbi:MAG: 50S ribosomal protein L29 [Halobacteriovoraceae bacterium]|mgnify:FL=1|jgi:large subunit ribosomal protein L29|nr:50S ribosomal protein L29 [Halobacteriovoraceae bacterium]